MVEEIGAWMAINSDAIYDTRPWKVYGEGPSVDKANPINGQGFNEGKVKYTSADVRFTTKKSAVYAIIMAIPEKPELLIKSFSTNNSLYPKAVKSVELLGTGKVVFSQTSEGLLVKLPQKYTGNLALVLKIK